MITVRRINRALETSWSSGRRRRCRHTRSSMKGRFHFRRGWSGIFSRRSHRGRLCGACRRVGPTPIGPFPVVTVCHLGEIAAIVSSIEKVVSLTVNQLNVARIAVPVVFATFFMCKDAIALGTRVVNWWCRCCTRGDVGRRRGDRGGGRILRGGHIRRSWPLVTVGVLSIVASVVF